MDRALPMLGGRTDLQLFGYDYDDRSAVQGCLTTPGALRRAQTSGSARPVQRSSARIRHGSASSTSSCGWLPPDRRRSRSPHLFAGDRLTFAYIDNVLGF